jgi:hypothetical protein
MNDDVTQTDAAEVDSYEAPRVDDLDTTEGPATTAAGKTLVG